MTDRENLEYIVFETIFISDPPIFSQGRGRELLGMKTMMEFRTWSIDYMEKGLDEYGEKRVGEVL